MPKPKMSAAKLKQIKQRREGPLALRYGPPQIKMPADPLAKSYRTKRRVEAFAIWFLVLAFVATEATAYSFNWSHALNEYAFMPYIYYPWAIFQWLYMFTTHHTPTAFRTQIAMAWLETVVVCALPFFKAHDTNKKLLLTETKRHKQDTDAEGSARFATPDDLVQTRLLKTDPHVPGIYIGEWEDPYTGERQWLRDTEDRHVVLLAPTRAGKGISIIIPTLLTWSGSLVANDPKGELYEICARARMAMGQYALKHEPTCTDGSGAKFNCLDEIRIGTVYDTKDSQQIAMFLVDPLGQGLDTGGDSDHWRNVAWGFLVGAVLHIMYSDHHQDKTLHGLDAFIDSGVMTEEQVLEEMLTTEHDPNYKYGWVNEKNQLTRTHPIVAAAARAMMNRPPGERGSAMSSARRYTTLYKDEIIAENTSRSDFSIDDIMQNPKGVSLFLVNTPADMVRIRGHMRMIVNLINSRFTDRVQFDWENGARGRQKKHYAMPLLVAQDEFTSTHGKLDTFVNALAFHAGFGIRCLIVAQDYSQLEGTYGDAGAQAIMANMHTSIYYASTNPKTAKQIENMLGTFTYTEREKISTGKGTKTKWTHKRRQLVFADEFTTMDPDYGICVIAGSRPIYVKKIRYFAEAAFNKLIAQPPRQSQSIPMQERAMNVKLAELREQNRDRIAKRKQNANGFAPPNIPPGKEEAAVSQDPLGGRSMTPYEGAMPFDSEGPEGAFGAPPPQPPVQRDKLDIGLGQLDSFSDPDEEAA